MEVILVRMVNGETFIFMSMELVFSSLKISYCKLEIKPIVCTVDNQLCILHEGKIVGIVDRVKIIEEATHL